MEILAQGENIFINQANIQIKVGWLPYRIGSLDVDPVLFVQENSGLIGSDQDVVFSNNSKSSCGFIRMNSEGYEIDLSCLDSRIAKISITLSVNSVGQSPFSFGDAQSIWIQIGDLAKYSLDLTGVREVSVILGEIYLKNNFWKFKAVGQGFIAGFSSLSKNFGYSKISLPSFEHGKHLDINAEIALNSAEKRMQKLAVKNPALSKVVNVVQNKVANLNLCSQRCKVALVLDISTSMGSLYRSGKVQHFVERAMAMAYRLDDNGEIDIFLFGEDAYIYGSLNMNSYQGFVSNMLKDYSLETSTRYGKVMRKVRSFYTKQRDWGRLPVFVMFVTDGNTSDKQLSEQMLVESSQEAIFWSFMAIGQTNKTTSDNLTNSFNTLAKNINDSNGGFEFLENLHAIENRSTANTNFFSVQDPSEPTDEQLFDKLVENFSKWQHQVVQQEILKLY